MIKTKQIHNKYIEVRSKFFSVKLNKEQAKKFKKKLKKVIKNINFFLETTENHY